MQLVAYDLGTFDVGGESRLVRDLVQRGRDSPPRRRGRHGKISNPDEAVGIHPRMGGEDQLVVGQVHFIVEIHPRTCGENTPPTGSL